jgi:hypothetical protein
MQICDHEGTTETDDSLSRCTECGNLWPTKFEGVPMHRLVSLADEADAGA